MSEAQKQAVRTVLELYEDIANITFVEVPDTGNGGQMRFGTAPFEGAGYAYYPSVDYTADNGSRWLGNPRGGDVWISHSEGNQTLTPGSHGYQTLIHEIGHALGLKHPGAYSASDTGPFLPGIEDNKLYSVMSYNAAPDSLMVSVEGTSRSYKYTWYHLEPETPMLYDVAAIQHLYGANTKTRAGDDIYRFEDRPFFMTLWDGGGNDTIDTSNFSRPSLIDLRPGSFSSIGQHDSPRDLLPSWYNAPVQPSYDGTSNLTIAYGVVIENAIGGSGDDILIGNDADNRLEGGAGNNILSGGGGNDILIGGSGTNTAIFSGSRAEYRLTHVANDGLRVEHLNNGRDGTNLLYQIDTLRFADTSIPVPLQQANRAPVVSASDQTVKAGASLKLGGIVSAHDADGDMITHWSFWDATSGNGHIAVNGIRQAEKTAITVPSSALDTVAYIAGTGGSADSLWARAWDGTEWSAWTSFKVSAQKNTPPTVTATDATVKAGTSLPLADRFSVKDADGDAITHYTFWDATPGNGRIVINGAAQAEKANILVDADSLADVYFTAGVPGTANSLWVRAWDGSDWSAWSKFSVSAKQNTPPVASGENFSSEVGSWTRIGGKLSASDADGDSITAWQLWGATSASDSGRLYAHGQYQPAAKAVQLSPSELAETWWRAGSAPGSDALYVRAHDGSDWSDWFRFTASTYAE
ncbi:M10 family metallopeptidase C-terminal domain-containing protein [Telmatospirillum sp. J64-1]|uniref:M10 family metallopeptidase C-terminal domain-containing protein n=1 Tax=Telmatospirillum sp. J64-1 TaxID=2502183 RepID=UPI00163D91BD|nr:M10 family metallopeptidase C-terminal domain-containing protein [Telmatospirillum sp. J64-1]